MGYESKIIIVERHEHEKLDGTLLPYGDDIACFDLSKMGYEQVNGKAFPAVFTNEIDAEYTSLRLCEDCARAWLAEHRTTARRPERRRFNG